MSECVVLVNCLLEIGCLLKSMEALIGRKGRRKNIIQYVIIAIILGISVYINLYDGNRLFQLLHYVGLFCIFKIRYGMNVIDTVTYFIFTLFVVGSLELFVCVPYNFICYILQIEDDFSFLIVLVVYMICCILNRYDMIVVNRKWSDIYKKKINVQFLIILFTLLLAFIISMVKFGTGLSWGEGVFLSGAFFMFFVLIHKVSAYQMEINCHERYAEKYGEVITELRERQHKFMNQLDSVYALCKIYDNYDELVRHQEVELNHLRRYMMPGKLLILERPLVMAHIYTKLCEAEEKQIEIYTNFSCSLENIGIPDIFLIEIIGNLIDNAMDEVSARKKHERIRMEIIDDGNEICISVGNEHEKILYNEYNQFFKDGYSSKGDDCGVGLSYVKKITDKYHGHIEVGNVIHGKENYFVVNIYFKR